MKFGRYTTPLAFSLVVALALAAGPSSVFAQHDSDHGSDQKAKLSALVKIIRQNTERFQDVRQAENEGYKLLFGCVSGPDYGAMGLHYVNMEILGKGEIDPTRPTIIIYEPVGNGRLRMTGADFLVFADQWNAKHGGGAPELMGQYFHYFEAPNRFGLPPFYTLHVWAWKDNPTGTFSNWHANVTCDAYAGQTP